MYKTWKDNEVALAKKREVKVRMELAHKLDKIQDASREISEVRQNIPNLVIFSCTALHQSAYVDIEYVFFILNISIFCLFPCFIYFVSIL